MMKETAQRAKKAAMKLSAVTGERKNAALEAIARRLERDKSHIFTANDLDVQAAGKQRLPAPLIHRLAFGEAKMAAVQDGLKALAALPNPVGRVTLARELTPGLNLYRVVCPIGVIGVIFESRPDALVQIASLCIKSGNAALLKGGSEAVHTNRALFDVLCGALADTDFPADTLSLLETRDEVGMMLKLEDDIDLIIPRGGNDFVRYIIKNSRIPVLGHADGVCHVYVDKACDINMAVQVAADSKIQNVSVCNAMETLLVHEEAAERFLPDFYKVMDRSQVKLHGCERACAVIPCIHAETADWRREYLDYQLAVRVVRSLDDAIEHINTYGSGHTDVIVTSDDQRAERFMTLVDSAGVFRNCSTRFSDGYRYGFGAEVGVATGKLHARGPMGLEGLCTYKYKLIGSGQTVADAESGRFVYTHMDL